jgi:hypothetical protein
MLCGLYPSARLRKKAGPGSQVGPGDQKGSDWRYSRDFWGSAMARVLLVEDEFSLLLLAESVVQGLGHSTFSASNVG